MPGPKDGDEDVDGEVVVVSAAAGHDHTALLDNHGRVWVFGTGLGRAVQVEANSTRVESVWCQRLARTDDELISSVASKINLHPYTSAWAEARSRPWSTSHHLTWCGACRPSSAGSYQYLTTFFPAQPEHLCGISGITPVVSGTNFLNNYRVKLKNML